MMHLSKVKKETNIRGITAQTLVDVEETVIKALTLQPHQTIPVHQVPVLVTFFVLNGSGSIRIGEVQYEVKEHSLVTCPKNAPMAVEAYDRGLVFLNIKTPAFKPKA